MKILIQIFLISFLVLNSVFGYFSRFLNLSTNSLEYQMLRNPNSFSLYEASLLASGVKESFLPDYLSQFSNIMRSVRQIQADNEVDRAKKVFKLMHQRILKNYVENATTLDVVLKTGSFNCLSSTLLYNSLLESLGYQARAVILPTHVFTQILTGSNRIDVENTTPFGFDVAENPQAQATLKKLTGFTYRSADQDREIVKKRGLIAYTYANRAFFAQKANLPYLAFQNALKSFALKPSSDQILTNVLAASVSYPAFLIDHKHDYTQAMAILEEALSNLEPHPDLIQNYEAALDRQINILIHNSDYEQARRLFRHAQKLLNQPLTDIYMNFIIRGLYRMINTDKQFSTAYTFITNATKQLAPSKDLDAVIYNGFLEIQKQSLLRWTHYPEGKEELLKWYRLNPKSKDFQAILEDYFSGVGIRFYEQKREPDRGISVIKEGLSIIPDSKLLKNNISYIANQTGISFLKKQEYKNGIKYLQISLRYGNQKSAANQNILTAYREWAYTEIDARRWKKALAIIKEGLKLYPTDSKLQQYKRYVGRKIK